MLKPFPTVAAALIAALLTWAPAAAQDVPVEQIATMSPAELAKLADSIVGGVAADARKLQPAAQRRDCAELTRAFNSFNLGYRMLGEADAALEKKPPREALAIRVRIVQSRVITFASRVKAEEWHTRVCRDFVPSAELAEDPRYSKPVPIGVTEFTEAAIEMRRAAEANLAAVMAAGMSKRCADVRSAMQSVELFIPYMEKLALDISKRPQALGPLASRRALEAGRNQLVAAANRVYREVGVSCQRQAPAPVPEAQPPSETPATPPGAGTAPVPGRPMAPSTLA